MIFIIKVTTNKEERVLEMIAERVEKKNQQQGEKQVKRSMKKCLGSAEGTGVKMINGHRYADCRDDFFEQVRK